MTETTEYENETERVGGRDACDLYRLLLLKGSGAELLLSKTEQGLLLPVLPISRKERATEKLNITVGSSMGIAAHCLFRSAAACSDEKSKVIYQVMEADDISAAAPDGMVWLRLDGLSERSFVLADDFAALLSVRREMSLAQGQSNAASVGRPGWLEQLRQWTEQEIAPLGLHLTGGCRQLNSGRGFALVRLETDGAAVWFKASSGRNHHERALTVALSHLLPGFVPPLIAVHPHWNGWLMLEAEGPLLEDTYDPRVWDSVAAKLAELEVASIDKVPRLLDSGCKDARVGRLQAQIEPFSQAMAELMARQANVPPRPLTPRELAGMVRTVMRACAEWQALSLPDTLGHLDFNPGNIVIGTTGCVFLDWAEACIASPFITFEYLLSHFHRQHSENDHDLVTAYVSRWAQVSGAEVAAKALRWAPLLAIATFAVMAMAWRDADWACDPSSAGCLRSLTRRICAEAAAVESWPEGHAVGAENA